MGIQLRGMDYLVKIFLNLMCRRIKNIYIFFIYFKALYLVTWLPTIITTSITIIY